MDVGRLVNGAVPGLLGLVVVAGVAMVAWPRDPAAPPPAAPQAPLADLGVSAARVVDALASFGIGLQPDPSRTVVESGVTSVALMEPLGACGIGLTSIGDRLIGSNIAYTAAAPAGSDRDVRAAQCLRAWSEVFGLENPDEHIGYMGVVERNGRRFTFDRAGMTFSVRVVPASHPR